MSDETPLREKLQTVDGVGEAKADELCDIINGHRLTYPPLVAKAIALAQDGEDRTAAVYLRRAAERDE